MQDEDTVVPLAEAAAPRTDEPRNEPLLAMHKISRTQLLDLLRSHRQGDVESSTTAKLG